MKDVLAIIGLMILYLVWLSSPLIMGLCAENDYDTVGKLVCMVYICGAVFVGNVLIKFIGIW